MEFKEFQDKIKELGEKYRKKGSELNRNLPPEIAFPYFKAVEEMGEVADLLSGKYGFNRKGKELSEDEFKDALGEELSDVIICLIHLANYSSIDLDEAMKKKIEEMNNRWRNKEY